jgi:hypothetical protein
MHVCPALRHFPDTMRAAVVASGASSPTITGDLPPSSSVTGVRLLAAARITLRPEKRASSSAAASVRTS